MAKQRRCPLPQRLEGTGSRYGVCPCGVARGEAGEIALDSPAAENPHGEWRNHAWGKRRGRAERRLYYRGSGGLGDHKRR